MQNDEVIWQVINHHFCSFKAKIDHGEQNFCRNEYNVTGLCNRSSCPLANSRYATIREHDGVAYLYLKTIERAHTPKNLWEKIKLPRNYTRALERVDKELQFFPKFLMHKNKQRLTKIHQYLIKMRKLKLQVRPKWVRVHKKTERREERREEKALTAAKLEKSIQNELLERLKKGTYGSIYNFPEQAAIGALDKAEEEFDAENEEELEAEDEEEDEEDIEFVEDFEEDDSDIEDLDDVAAFHDDNDSKDELKKRKSGRDAKTNAKRKKRGGKDFPHVEIEYEDENESVNNQSQAAW